MGYLQNARQRLASAAHLVRKHARTAGKVALGAAAAAAAVAGVAHADRAMANEVRRARERRAAGWSLRKKVEPDLGRKMNLRIY